MSDFAALLGIDWADAKHDLCLIEATTQHKEFRTLKHTPEALQDFFLGLRQRFAGQPIAVAVEQARGPLLFALLKYEFLTLYPIHPPRSPATVKLSHPPAPRTIPPTPNMPPNCYCIIATASPPGNPMMSRRAACNCWSSSGAAWSVIAPASAIV